MKNNNWQVTRIDHKEITIADAIKGNLEIKIDGDKRTAYQTLRLSPENLRTIESIH